MKSSANWFNLIFIFTALLLGGCQTDKPKVDPKQKAAERALQKKYKKQRAVIELFVETAPNSGSRSVSILRQNPIHFNVQTNAFLDSRNILDATVVDYLDGYGIQLQLDRHGTFVMDTMTTANRGRHILVRARYGETSAAEERWLAAPVIGQRNSSGVLSFTPDATREEAEKIVQGVKNLATDLRRRGQLE